MISAEMKGKVPRLANREDILTSNVFDLLGLIDYKFLADILANARNIDGKRCRQLDGKTVKDVELWKRVGMDEPDACITLKDGTKFVLEIKYFSGEHNKEVENEAGKRETQGQLKKYIDETGSPFLIYLTQNYRALKDLNEESKTYGKRIYHIHWEEFNGHLQQHARKCTGFEKKVLDRLTEYLDFKGFFPWEGFKFLEIYKRIDTKGIDGFFHGISSPWLGFKFREMYKKIDTNTRGFYHDE